MGACCVDMVEFFLNVLMRQIDFALLSRLQLGGSFMKGTPNSNLYVQYEVPTHQTVQYNSQNSCLLPDWAEGLDAFIFVSFSNIY